MGEHHATMCTDRDLLAALKRGDDAAWQDAFQRLYPSAFAAARHPLASLTPTEAEDIAIEALTLLLPKVKQVAEFDELRLLVITIASRKAISEKRRQLADKRGGGDLTSLDALQDDETIRFEPAEQLASHLGATDLRELSSLLDAALSGLEPRQAELVRDFLVHHLAYKELAKKYRMPIGSVGVSLARSLDKIRAHLRAMPKLWKELAAYLR
jgi:RNA polymerase sigma factor (sigma-70 family)